MIRALLSCLCLPATVVGAFAQQPGNPDGPVGADRLWFDVTIEPEFVLTDGAYVGGEIVMHVQFVSSDPFKRIRLELPVIDGARADMLVRPHTLQIELEGDEGYSILGNKVYSHDARLAIVPTQSGTLVIPPITVTGISEPSNVASFQFNKTFPEQNIVVHPKSPDFAGDAWIVSREVTVAESWSHVISDIQNGDTVRRTVTLSVAGVTADDLPELVLDANDGYRVLSTEVSAETEVTDAGFVAHLEQSWDIYVETEDVTYIDGVGLLYWNPESAKSEVAAVPRQRVEPLKSDAIELRRKLHEEALAGHKAQRLGLMVLGSLPAAALIGLLAVALWRAAPTRADVRFWRGEPTHRWRFIGRSWIGAGRLSAPVRRWARRPCRCSARARPTRWRVCIARCSARAAARSPPNASPRP